MTADGEQPADELVLRDLPGTLAILVFAVTTAALGWEVWGVLFRSGLFIRPLGTLDPGDVLGISLFLTGWFALLVGLLVVRHRRRAPAR